MAIVYRLQGPRLIFFSAFSPRRPPRFSVVRAIIWTLNGKWRLNRPAMPRRNPSLEGKPLHLNPPSPFRTIHESAPYFLASRRLPTVMPVSRNLFSLQLVGCGDFKRTTSPPSLLFKLVLYHTITHLCVLIVATQDWHRRVEESSLASGVYAAYRVDLPVDPGVGLEPTASIQ